MSAPPYESEYIGNKDCVSVAIILVEQQIFYTRFNHTNDIGLFMWTHHGYQYHSQNFKQEH